MGSARAPDALRSLHGCSLWAICAPPWWLAPHAGPRFVNRCDGALLPRSKRGLSDRNVRRVDLGGHLLLLAMLGSGASAQILDLPWHIARHRPRGEVHDWRTGGCHRDRHPAYSRAAFGPADAVSVDRGWHWAAHLCTEPCVAG